MSKDSKTQGHVYFEIRQLGAYVKVSAIDGTTGKEVSVSGPAEGYNEPAMKRLALRKLQFVMQKQKE